jgi:hypothetical protein
MPACIIMAEINEPFLADWPETAQITTMYINRARVSGIFQLTKENIVGNLLTFTSSLFLSKFSIRLSYKPHSICIPSWHFLCSYRPQPVGSIVNSVQQQESWCVLSNPRKERQAELYLNFIKADVLSNGCVCR